MPDSSDREDDNFDPYPEYDEYDLRQLDNATGEGMYEREDPGAPDAAPEDDT